MVMTPGSGARAPRGAGYAADTIFGVRVAGIPAERVAALRFRRTWSEVDEAVRLAGRVTAEGERLADVLHALIGAGRRPELKPALVALRRDLFAGRRPRARVLTPAIMDFLPGPVAGELSAWLDDLDRLARVRAGISGLLDHELTEKTAVLRDATRLFEFRQGLAQSSPDLSERLDAWLDAPDDRAPGRQTLLRLAKYLARAAMKTSPYATFAASGLGRWSPEGDAAAPARDLPATGARRRRPGPAPATDDLRMVGVAEADRSVVYASWLRAARQPGLRDAVVLRVNPSAVEEDGRLWFLGHLLAEPINSLPASASLRAVLDVIRSDPGATYGAVAERLTFAGDAATVDRLLTTLIDGGLVERCPPFSDRTADALPRLIDWMARALPEPTGEPARLLASLRAIDAAVTAYALHPAERKRQWRADADRLAEKLAPAGTGAGSPRLMHESYVLAGTAVRRPSASLRPMYDDLNHVRRFLALLDPSLPLKIALADYFLQVYGPAGSVPFLTFYRRIHDMDPQAGTGAERAVRRFLEVAPRPLGPGAGRVRDRYGPRVARLGELRRTFWKVLHAAQEKAGEGNPMPVAVLDELTASWPPFVPPATSISVYGQVMTAPDGPRLVVNGVVTGPRRGMGRIRHLLGVAGDQAADAGEPVVVDPAFAEFRVSGGSNLDLRPRVSPVIDYPFTGGDDAEPGIPPTELLVEYDGDRELLVLRGPGGSPLRPLHLGLTSEVFLPPAQSLLVRGFGANPTVMMPGWVLRGGLRYPPASAVEYAPRLTVGAVVLARARWRMRAGEFPAPAKGEDRGVYLIRLARWLGERGIPRAFFARVMEDRYGYGTQGPIKSRKPLYVDVTNWFLLQDFVRALGHPDRLVVLEEALPALPDVPRYGEHGSRVTEYIFDLAATEDSGER